MLRPVRGVERDVTASGVRVRVAEQGSGPHVMLLHGLFADGSTWDRVAGALARDYHVVVPDLPGFGASEKPAPQRFPYGVDAFVESMADLYAGLELGRASVVGHGLGGAIALSLAARHPELVARLVLVDALCGPMRPGLWGRLVQWPLVGGFVLKQLWGRTVFRSFYRDRVLSPHAKLPLERVDAYYESFSTPAARGSALATLRSIDDTRPLAAQTVRVQTPTLVLWGRHDRIVPASIGQRLAREIRGAGFELLDAGHAPHEEQPERVSTIIARFLEAATPSTGYRTSKG
jgi:pimeloyl-ACP methyl ester carboxylesterase